MNPHTANISSQLASACGNDERRLQWLRQLPQALADLEQEWSLTLDGPFGGKEGSCAWVAPATLRDGSIAVLKLGMPHMEADHEIEGLRFWNGDPTVRLLAADDLRNAMLLERCEPGTTLRERPEPEQDVVIAGLIRRLWRVPSSPHVFRPLSLMAEDWITETLRHRDHWPDSNLIREGLHLFEELSAAGSADVLLATDLHAGNVLRARREPWLAIDPKPFVGDPAYDATQHLLNCRPRLRSNPEQTIGRFAELLELDHERVRLWTFARAALEAGRSLRDSEWMELAQALKPSQPR